MIFKLLNQLSEKEFHLRRINPYNVDILFMDLEKEKLTCKSKKQVCAFLDLLRALIEEGEIKFIGRSLVLFEINYNEMNMEELLDILTHNIPQQHNYIRFIFRRIGCYNNLKLTINLLDEKKLTNLFEDVSK